MQKYKTHTTTDVEPVEEIEVPPPADLAETDALLDKLNEVIGDEDEITQEVILADEVIITDEEADAVEDAFMEEMREFAQALAASFCQPQDGDKCPCGFDWANCIRGNGAAVMGVIVF